MTAKTIPAIRADIAKLKSELGRIEAAGRPVAETLPGLAAQIAALAEPYRKGICRAAAAVLAARTDADTSLYRAFCLEFGQPEFAVGAVAALLGERIVANIEAEITMQAPACPAALSDDERRAALASLRRRLRSLERDEESMILADRAIGNHVTRRPDADPAAVLGIPDGILEEIGL